MANLLRYAVELDLRGNFIGGAWEHTDTSVAFGIYGGFIRACTGTENLTIDGATYRTGLLLDQFKGERQTIDITEGGNYATFSTIDFGLNNVSGLYDWLRNHGIFTKNAPVRFWAIEGTTQYLRWVGVVDSDDYSIDEVKFSCIDASKTLHKTLPPETVNPAAFGWAKIEEESRGAAIPVCIGAMQDALLLPATKGENKFIGVYGFRKWESVTHLAYFPSYCPDLGDGKADSLRKMVICVGIAAFAEDAFKGRFIRAISGGGEGTVRRIVASSSTQQIGLFSPNGYQYTTGRQSVYGVQITLEAEWPFEMTAGVDETDPPKTATNWAQDVSYTVGTICAFNGDVYRCLLQQTAGSAAPTDDRINWKAIYYKKPIAVGDSSFCMDGEAINDDFLGVGNWAPVFYPVLTDFAAGVTIFELFAFDATLIASQRPVNRIDIARNSESQQSGLRTKKDGEEISLPDIGDSFPSGLFSGRSYSGVRVSRASFAADKKVSASLRIGSVLPQFGCFMAAATSCATPTGFITFDYSPEFAALTNSDWLNQGDEARSLGDAFVYRFIDSAGVEYSEVGKFPYFAQNNASRWDIKTKVRTLPDVDDISGSKQIIPALRAKLFIDCPAAFSARVSLVCGVKVKSKFVDRLLLGSGASIKTEDVSISGAGTIELEISLFSFFAKENEALFFGLLEAIKIDSVVSGKRLKSWLDYVEIELDVVVTTSNPADGVQPYLRIYEGGLAAKGDVDLGDFRASLLGEVWGDLTPARYAADDFASSYPSVIEYLLRAYDGLGDAQIDVAAFDGLNAISRLNAIPVSRQIVDAKNGREYLIELAAQGMLGLISKQGKRSLRSWMDETTVVRAFETDATDPNCRVVDGSLQDVAKIPLSKVPTEARVRFNYSTGDKKFRSEIYITRTWEEAFPEPDEVAFGGSYVADVEVLTIFAVNIRFAGVAPECTYGDSIGFSANGVQYVGQVASITIQEDGTAIFWVSGYDSANRLTFTLPDTDLSQIYPDQDIAPLGGFLWQQYAQGFDSQYYAEAKAIWERFRNAYKRVRQVQQLPARLGDCYWIHSNDVELQDAGGAINYLDLISLWVTRPREEIAFDVQAEGNLDLALLDYVTFKDVLLFGGESRAGWITEIYLMPNKGTIGLQIILSNDPLDPYQDEQLIDEGFGVGTIGNTWGTIDETTEADTIDEA